MAAYYNENDPKTAAWLRELIAAGLITDGEVDTRSIVDVRPADLRGFVQCHFFAGIGGWSCALRLAGWSDDRPVWTGSCPCQPFSSAGAQAGGHDPRDLWPAWFQLVRECRPVVVFGEQVEAAIAHGWLDRLCDDLEREGYAVGAAGLPAASVGAFHIRQRLWFVAESDGAAGERDAGSVPGTQAPERGARELDGDFADGLEHGGAVGVVADTAGSEWRAQAEGWGDVSDGPDAGRQEAHGRCRVDCQARELGDADRIACGQGHQKHGWWHSRGDAESRTGLGSASRIGASWSAADWIACRDGKRRPVEPGTFPLAHGLPARVVRLRGYGNAIVPPLAAEFIAAYLDARG